jgi:hypothetical protein
MYSPVTTKRRKLNSFETDHEDDEISRHLYEGSNDDLLICSTFSAGTRVHRYLCNSSKNS